MDNASNCVPPDPANTVTDRLNRLLSSSGPGYVLNLCPGQKYLITAPILFAAPNQEITTLGYPTGDERATLVVSGPVENGKGHTIAVDGTCEDCDGVRLRHVQVNGTRLGANHTSGGANIEMGGRNSNQLIEYVHSYDPRDWSCLHIAEGPRNSCNNVTVQNNDIGPAGSDAPQEWADGISVACRNSLIRNNMINNPTDGAIVLFGAPGTRVENNTIWVNRHTMLGGINLVDIIPFGGDYDGVIVTNNIIAGGFASQTAQGSQTKGSHDNDVIIKIAIAIGPRVWFGNKFANNVSTGAAVLNNQLTGAFGYGIAMNGATNFTVENNVLVGNTSFIGGRGPNCAANDPVPPPAPLIIDLRHVTHSTTQSNFTPVIGADSLICMVPPTGNYWPFGGDPSSTASPVSPPYPPLSTSARLSSTGTTVDTIACVISGVFILVVLAWLFRKRALRCSTARLRLFGSRDYTGYALHKEC
ncbi:pectin lyase fold/virulence factor [Melanogaster broomeanus]|nr:pectin lyase fold/virulence factor [Melanogaster broomeanus]